MKTKIATVAGIILVILGAITGVLSGFGANITGLVAVLFGAGAAIYGMWQSRDPQKPAWMSITSIALLCAGAIIAGITGFMDEEKLITLVGSVISIVLAVIGVLANKYFLKHGANKKVEATK